MKFLIVGLLKGSQITRFREEAGKLGHEVDGCAAADLVIKSGDGKLEVSVNGQNLNRYDLIYLCAGVESKRRFEWYIACDFLMENSKVKIVNEVTLSPSQKYYPIQSWFYLKQYENGISQPLTYTVFNDKNLDEIIGTLGSPVIVKLSETHQGKGIFLCNSEEEIKGVIAKNPGQTYLLRKFIPNDGDLRVFVVGGRAIGAMKRISTREGEFRSNISVGGKGKFFDLEKNKEIKELAEKSAKVTGVEIAGVDVIINKETSEPYILEVNVGPQFKGLEKYTRVNVAGEIIKYFASKCE